MFRLFPQFRTIPLKSRTKLPLAKPRKSRTIQGFMVIGQKLDIVSFMWYTGCNPVGENIFNAVPTERKQTMQDISQWSKYKEDIKSSTTLGAIQDAFEDPLYKGGFMTDYEVIEIIRGIIAKSTPPEVNTIDANTGLRYTAAVWTSPHLPHPSDKQTNG